MSESRGFAAGSPRSEPNLMPHAILSRISRRRASRMAFALSAGFLTASGALFGGAVWLDTRSEMLEQLARERGMPVVRIEEEIARLEADRAVIVAQLEAQREVGVAIPAASLVGAIAAHLPDGTVLHRLAIEYANVQGVARKVRRHAKEVEPARELRGEITGIAADESDVGRIVDAIGALAPVSRVALESSRSQEFQGRNVREFRVTFAVDLEKRWRLPPIASANVAATNNSENVGGER